jgi:hypothetical protein
VVRNLKHKLLQFMSTFSLLVFVRRCLILKNFVSVMVVHSYHKGKINFVLVAKKEYPGISPTSYWISLNKSFVW